jgi:tetratricopeptide (TPR) repeat protein
MTDTYIRARKFFFKSLKDFFLVSLFSVDDVQLLKFINELTSNKEIKTVEEKGPFISSSIISQLIKAETLCNIGISETLSPTYFNEGIQAYSKIINSLAQNNEMFQAKIFKRIAAVYKKKGEFKMYREYLQKIKSIFFEKDYKNNCLKIADLNVDIALSYLCCKTFDESVSYLEQALGVLMENGYEDLIKMADIQKLMGINHSKKGNYEEALSCYYRSLDIIISLKTDGENEEIYYLFYLICVIHVKKHDYFVSLEYLKKARGVIYSKKDSAFKKQLLEFFGYYKKYLDHVDENIWINFNWDNEKN